MNSWQLIFAQSRANNGRYDEDGLPEQNWDLPQGTWFQKRLRFLREAVAKKRSRRELNEA